MCDIKYVALFVIVLTSSHLTAFGDGSIEVAWTTIDSGGGISMGGGFELAGTMGQCDAGAVMIGGDFALEGGFWPGVSAGGPTTPGDCDGGGDVDLVDYGNFADCLAGPGGGMFAGCGCFDVDADGDVDLRDFGDFQVDFGG